MDIAKEFFACLALKHAEKIGPKTCKAILLAYDTAYDAVQDVAHWGAKKIARAHQIELFRKETWRPQAEFEYKAAKLRSMKILTWGDTRYPDTLRNIPDPPLALYYRGDLSLISNPAVAVVGARKSTQYGLEQARSFSEALSRMGLSIVSGLARGIDRQAHLGGLAGVGSSIAVLGAGLDHKYPVENADVRQALEERGLVVSEYPPGTIPDANHFPYRNRIIAGLSLGVLVAEAANKSGSLITARLATEQGREVFALPGPLGQPTFVGCNSLLKQGACLVQSAEDIVHELAGSIDSELSGLALASSDIAPKKQEAAPVPSGLPPDEATLLAALHPVEKIHIDDLTRTLGWESSRVSQLVLILEINGLVRQWPGMTYTRA